MVKNKVFSLVLLILSISMISAWSADITSPTNGTYFDGKPTEFSWSTDGVNLENQFNFTINGNFESGLTNRSELKEALDGLDILEGWNELNITVMNNSGSIQEDSIIFWVDSIDPDLTFISPGQYTNQDFFEINWTINETNKYDYGLNQFSKIWIWQPEGDNYPSLSDATVGYSKVENEYYKHTSGEDLSQEGTYNYLVMIAEKYLNGTKIGDFNFEGTIIRDITNPSLTISHPQPSMMYSSVVTNITFNASDTNLGECNFTNSTATISVNCSQPFLTSSTEGNNTWNLTAYDLAGNYNHSSITFYVDSLFPLVNFTSPTTLSGSYSLNSIYANVSVIESYPDTTIIYLFNDTGIVNFTIGQEINFTGLADGTYYLNATANDTLGNTNQTETRTIVLDSTYPLISFTSPTLADNSFSNQDSITINLSITEANKANLTYNLYNISGDLINSTITLSEILTWNNLEDGNYSYNVTIVDSVGNTNQTETRTIILDSTVPSIGSITFPSDDPFNLGDNILIEFNTTDNNNLDNCSLILDGSLNDTITPITQGITYNFTLSGLTAGQHNYSIQCYDVLGNLNQTDTMYFTILTALSEVSEFTNYTNLSLEPNISDVFYFFVANNYGMINFTEAIDFSSGLDWTQYINISQNRILSNHSIFNVSSEITLYNITYSNPRPTKDNSFCSSCIEISPYVNNTFLYNTTGIGIYASEETSTGGGSSGGSSSGTCSTHTWTCEEWSTCDEILFTQTRTCTSNCLDTKEETQLCIPESETSEEEELNTTTTEEAPQSTSGITGAAIGARTVQIGGAIIFLSLISVVWLFARSKKNSIIKEKTKAIIKESQRDSDNPVFGKKTNPVLNKLDGKIVDETKI